MSCRFLLAVGLWLRRLARSLENTMQLSNAQLAAGMAGDDTGAHGAHGAELGTGNNARPKRQVCEIAYGWWACMGG